MTILKPRVRAIGTIYSILTLMMVGLLVWGLWHLFTPNDSFQIQGRWQLMSQVVEFQADGQVTGLAVEPMRYELLSSSELRLIGADGKQQTVTYALTTAQLRLVMVDAQGQMQTLILQALDQ